MEEKEEDTAVMEEDRMRTDGDSEDELDLLCATTGGRREADMEEDEQKDDLTIASIASIQEVIERRVRFGTWNIHGLSDHKQEALLVTLVDEEIDILAVTESHLVTSEQWSQWHRCVQKDGRFLWMGRPARAPRGAGAGRGSGGVGLLVRADWGDQVAVLEECQHDLLHFMRVDLPDAPFPLVFGVAYCPPVGSYRYEGNADLLEELEERVALYRSSGAAVCIGGDFNQHIAEYPSTIASTRNVLRGADPTDADDSEEDEYEEQLVRSSVDARGNDEPGGAYASSIAFVNRMDNAGMVILNGLSDVGEGTPAYATRRGGGGSVIDFILINSEHWRHMESVIVRKEAADGVLTDHHLTTSELRYDPIEINDGRTAPARKLLDSVSFLISSEKYAVEARGDKAHFRRFQDAFASSMAPMLERWTAEASEGVEPSVEERWGDVARKIRSCAAECLPRSKPGAHQTPARRARPRDQALKQWKRRRAQLTREKSQHVRSSEEWVLLDDQYRQLGNRMKHHFRKIVHNREREEIAKIRQLQGIDRRSYWSALRGLVGPSTASGKVPAAAVDFSGVETSSTDEVRQVWLNVWRKLAEHRPNDPHFDSDFREQVERKMEAKQDAEGKPVDVELPPKVDATDRQKGADALNRDITLEEAEGSVRRLKNGKSPGSDGIISELLKNGGKIMRQCLLHLCNLAFRKAEVPMDWLRGVVVPLYKDGDKRDPLNYRPVTLLSIVGKVYTGVLQERLLQWCEKHGILVVEQGGFRPGRGCPEQIFTLTELIKIRRRRKRHTYTCFIDIKKAYDTVWHDGLKAKLQECGIGGRMYRAICSLYEGCESTLRLGGNLGYTDFFPIQTGVRQGCILSPLLYSIFINDLAEELRNHPGGAKIDAAGKHVLTVLLYADDIVLMAETEEELQALMSVVDRYGHRWRFQVNPGKCGLLKFRHDGGKKLPTSELRLGDKIVQWVSKYKYLGVELHNGVPFRDFRKRMLRSAISAGYQVAAMGMYSCKLPVPIGVQVYKSLVRPLLEYAAEVTSLSPWAEAEQLQLSMAKRILQCPFSTSSVACMGELGWMTMEGRFQLLRVSFYIKIIHSDRGTPLREVYEESMRAAAEDVTGDDHVPEVAPSEGWQVYRPSQTAGGMTFWCEQIKCDLYQLGLAEHWRQPDPMQEMGVTKWKAITKKAVREREEACWQKAALQRPILRTYMQCQFMLTFQIASYLMTPHGGWKDLRLEGRKAMTRLRCGTNELRIHTGRFIRLPEQERVCQLCIDEVEDERHFLLRCAFFSRERETLWRRIDQLVNACDGSDSDAMQLDDAAPETAAANGSTWRTCRRETSCF